MTCVLIGEGAASAPLFGLAERLRERGCAVHMLLGATTDAHLFGALEARRATRGVTVTTEDGSVGIAGTVADVLPDLLTRTEAEVVYASGRQPPCTRSRRWPSGTGPGAGPCLPLDVPMPCGTGLCQAARCRSWVRTASPRWSARAPRARCCAATGSAGRTSARSRRTRR